jgi:hypothetical protein
VKNRRRHTRITLLTIKKLIILYPVYLKKKNILLRKAVTDILELLQNIKFWNMKFRIMCEERTTTHTRITSLNFKLFINLSPVYKDNVGKKNNIICEEQTSTHTNNLTKRQMVINIPPIYKVNVGKLEIFLLRNAENDILQMRYNIKIYIICEEQLRHTRINLLNIKKFNNFSPEYKGIVGTKKFLPSKRSK